MIMPQLGTLCVCVCLLNEVIIVLELTVGLVAAYIQSDVALTFHSCTPLLTYLVVVAP